MPRFRITDYDDIDDAQDDLGHEEPFTGRSRPGRSAHPTVVVEGRSGRVRIDTDSPVETPAPGDRLCQPGLAAAGAPLSSYDVASHGPDPVPDWVVTSLSARDTRLGAIKSGKEADVELLHRAVPDGVESLLAVKTFRTAEHRMFHRDAGYLEGRRVKRSRETRAMAQRTAFGRELLAGRWAAAEFGALGTLWEAGARVPYPVQMIGTELMMEFIGTPDGRPAPRLANHQGTTAEFTDLWHQLTDTLTVVAEAGYTHGDLSPYNVLVDGDGCVLIDLPQLVDLVANPQGMTYLRRDCARIAEFFARRNVPGADGELLALHLGSVAVP